MRRTLFTLFVLMYIIASILHDKRCSNRPTHQHNKAAIHVKILRTGSPPRRSLCPYINILLNNDVKRPGYIRVHDNWATTSRTWGMTGSKPVALPLGYSPKWWRGRDSNSRTLRERIYSPPRLATSLPLHIRTNKQCPLKWFTLTLLLLILDINMPARGLEPPTY